MSHKLLIDKKTRKVVLLDTKYNTIKDFISEDQLIDNIDFTKLPINVFNNPELYFIRMFRINNKKKS